MGNRVQSEGLRKSGTIKASFATVETKSKEL